MSSNIRVNKICEYCQKEFEARKTTTKTCSDNCAKLLYKAKQKALKIETVQFETRRIKAKPIEDLKAKEFLTVRDLARLLNCSKRTAYYLIENGNIKAVNIAQRKTLIKRSEIDKLFA
jgi:excisionase family DNA binding protein